MTSQPLDLKVVSYEKGAYIIIEGERIDVEHNAEFFYIVREGKVKLYRDVQATDEQAGGVITAGGVFGVISTMAGYCEYIETVRALTDVTLIAVRRNQFSGFIRANPTVALKIMLQFSERMRELNDALTGSPNIKKPSGKNNSAKTDGANNENSEDEINMDDSSLRTFKKDTMIFSEGDVGNEVFIVKNGQVKISKKAQAGEVLLAILNQGSIFGELALLSSTPRTATASAYTDCQLITLDREKFLHLIKTEPQMIERLTAQLAERIWLLYKQLANTMVPDAAGRLFDMLLVQLEKKRVNLSSNSAYKFDFGPKELVEMTGISGNTDAAVEKLLQNRYVIVNPFGTITIQNIIEFVRQALYFRKMQKTYQEVLKSMPK